MEANVTVNNNKSGKLLDESYVAASCSKNLSHQLACRKIMRNPADHDDDDEDDVSSCSTSASADLWSEEIPIWVENEQRYISGITRSTTCNDLVEALLSDDCVTGRPGFKSKSAKDYVITERWRKVEQILDGRTHILKIWNAWGKAQPEVKFNLKPLNHHTPREICPGDRDSGRESPTGSINSGITRRKRHKASKQSFTWMTHGHTIHPKSQKSSIERLMKLILEQGEIIQQQLAKLRDRETEISTIEEERHKHRESKYGKNYLLETYLKSLHEEKESGAGNSDSGVHTEEVTTSPEVAASPQLPDDNQTVPEQKDDKNSTRLDLEMAALSLEEGAVGGQVYQSQVEQEIELLEKIVTVNKQLIKEEEQLVKLNAKLKRYTLSSKDMSQEEILAGIQRINEQLQRGNDDLEVVDDAIAAAEEMIKEKNELLNTLFEECDRADAMENGREVLVDYDYDPMMLMTESQLNLSREYLADNLYNVSKTVLQSTQIQNQNHSMGVPSEVEPLSDMFVYPIQPPSQFCTPYDPDNTPAQAQVLNLNGFNTNSCPNPSNFTYKATPVTTVLYSPQSPHPLPPPPVTFATNPALVVVPPPPPPPVGGPYTASQFNPNDFMNYFEKYNQRNINNVMAATSLKLGPKKLINGIVMQQQHHQESTNSTSNSSDTGLSLTSDPDFNQFSTLV